MTPCPELFTPKLRIAIQSRHAVSVMIPRDDKLKPAVIYFPGGGFTSADYEKFTEMRYALAKAGFVVAAAEYRVVPNKFPALLEDANPPCVSSGPCRRIWH